MGAGKSLAFVFNFPTFDSTKSGLRLESPSLCGFRIDLIQNPIFSFKWDPLFLKKGLIRSLPLPWSSVYSR